MIEAKLQGKSRPGLDLPPGFWANQSNFGPLFFVFAVLGHEARLLFVIVFALCLPRF